MGKIELKNIEKNQLSDLLRQLDTVTNGACLDDLNNEQVLDKQLELVEVHANLVNDCENAQLPIKCWVNSFTSTCEDPELTDIELPFSGEDSMASNIQEPFVNEMTNMAKQAIELWVNRQPGQSGKPKQTKIVDRSMLSLLKMEQLAESFKIKAKVKKEKKKNHGRQCLVSETPSTSKENKLIKIKRRREWRNDITNNCTYDNLNS